MIVHMLKKATEWAVREPQHMFHGLVPTEYLRRYCEEQQTTKDFIIPDIMTQDYHYRQRNGRYEQKRIFEIKTMRVDSCRTMYCPGNPQLRAVEKRTNLSMKSYLNRCKKLDEKLRPTTTRDRSHQHTSLTAMVVLSTWWWVTLANSIRALSCSLPVGSQSETGKMTPANSTDVGEKDAVKLIKKR